MRKRVPDCGSWLDALALRHTPIRFFGRSGTLSAIGFG
jgi:hypothetical protein